MDFLKRGRKKGRKGEGRKGGRGEGRKGGVEKERNGGREKRRDNEHGKDIQRVAPFGSQPPTCILHLQATPHEFNSWRVPVERTAPRHRVLESQARGRTRESLLSTWATTASLLSGLPLGPSNCRGLRLRPSRVMLTREPYSSAAQKSPR